MRLVVFGANGPTGRLVVKQAAAAGHRVVAVTRRPADYPVTGPLVEVARADVTDADAVAAVVRPDVDAVISTYGVPYSRQPISVYSEGMAHVVAAMTAAGVGRLVCVTSTTVAAEEAPGMSLAWRKVIEPLLRRVLGRTLYDDMERMEDVVRRSDLAWTIVRPAGLYDADEPSGDHTVSTGRLSGHHTSRADSPRCCSRRRRARATRARRSRSSAPPVPRTRSARSSPRSADVASPRHPGGDASRGRSCRRAARNIPGRRFLAILGKCPTEQSTDAPGAELQTSIRRPSQGAPPCPSRRP
ncbi:NAD(P)H-binding protein [uncultured Nocardioides sp.]|uniref:NAD(P)-dependent oxidoreductase n=1 Tax=uncultured Nocardioides sp. TaxID=198441 RepID=UPI00262EC79B|nr:NAD(P)H-binding protein [uncultured Nocardioides sp.]